MNRGAVNQVGQIGVESTSGTAVAANRYTAALSWLMGREGETGRTRARGSKVNTTHVRKKEMAKGSVEGVLCYNSHPYIFDSLFNPATPSQIGALTAYTRVWTPGVRTADSTGKTYTVEVGDATACEDYAYAKVLGFDLEASQDEFSVKGPLISRAPVDNQSLSGSITTIAERLVERNDINLYIDTTYGGLGGTQFTEPLSESVSIGEKFKEFFVHNRSAGEFHDIVEVLYEPIFKFSSVHNSQSRTLIALLNTNPYRWIRWEAIGQSLGTHSAVEYFEKIWIDMCVKFDTPARIEDEDGPLGYDYSCTMMPDDAGLGSYMRITSVSALAAI
jgi:hypothetical protein